MSPSAIVSLLKALQVDVDVKSLIFTGSLYYRDAMRVVDSLQTLLQADQRHWKNISLQDLQFVASTSRNASLARRSCQLALLKVAKQRYIPIQMH